MSRRFFLTLFFITSLVFVLPSQTSAQTFYKPVFLTGGFSDNTLDTSEESTETQNKGLGTWFTNLFNQNPGSSNDNSNVNEGNQVEGGPTGQFAGEYTSSFNLIHSQDYTQMQNTLNNLVGIINFLTNVMLGIAILTGLLIFAISFVQLAITPDSPREKLKSMSIVANVLIGIALLGSSKLLTTLILGTIFGS